MATVKTAIETLLALAGPSLGSPLTHLPDIVARQAASSAKELNALLSRKNGFMAFEQALHVFPVGSVGEGYDLVTWNSQALWRSEYGDLAEGYLFFAEDVFGEQFALKQGKVWRFYPETGKAMQVAKNLEGWAKHILQDYNAETGYSLAHDWQQRHGLLPSGKRLVPTIPFALGGAFELSNVHAGDAVESMRFRASLAQQIRNLPDGAKIRLKLVE